MGRSTMDTQYMRRRVCTVVRAVVCLLSTSLLTTCDFTGIFAAIQSEVPIKTPSIPGAIYGLVKAGSKLYATNGRLWEKELNGTESWQKVSSSSVPTDSDKKVMSIATDGTNFVLACVPGTGVYKHCVNGAVGSSSTAASGSTETCSNHATLVGGTSTPFWIVPGG
ncbi:hypothetical protein KD967_05215, partial [Treponema pallidum]